MPVRRQWSDRASEVQTPEIPQDRRTGLSWIEAYQPDRSPGLVLCAGTGRGRRRAEARAVALRTISGTIGASCEECECLSWGRSGGSIRDTAEERPLVAARITWRRQC